MSEIRRFGNLLEMPDGKFCLYTDHLAEVERRDKALAAKDAENAALKAELAAFHTEYGPEFNKEHDALVKALNEATRCSCCFGDGDYQVGEDEDEPCVALTEECEVCEGTGRYFDLLSPDSLALCERLEKEGVFKKKG